MREEMREHLNTEITRKQFLQYLGAGILMVFGFENLISLLTGHRVAKQTYFTQPNTTDHGFGSRSFGV